jgi:hypothetical protein
MEKETDGFFVRCLRSWQCVREFVRAMKPVRLPILLVAAGLAFLLLASQGEDVARALAERRTGELDASQTFWFFAATLAWSLSAWYWARVMLFLELPGVPEKGPGIAAMRSWLPRLLGFAAALGVAAAFYFAARGYAEDEHPDVKVLLQSYAGWTLAGAIAFLLAVSVRRPLARRAYALLKDRRPLQGAAAQRMLAVLDMPSSKAEAYGAMRLKDLGMATRLLLALAMAAAVVLFGVFTFATHWAAPAMGSAAILLIAAACWIAAGCTLDYIGMRLHVPLFSALLVLAVVFSLWNDNHAVRTLDFQQPAQRADLAQHLRTWMARNEAKLAGGKTIPLYVVNAEGGGIRAAYWTVTVLGEIQNRNPCFAEHLFSLSGVSGGSLGASVFVALLAHARETGNAPACGTRPAGRSFDIKSSAQAVLGEDFLSPVVAGMLYPDLVQRVLFFPVARFDRAATLERAWELAWARHVGGRNRLSEPLDRLWEDQAHWTPALFLNATWVETGKRIIASNVRVAAAADSESFVDSEDAQAFFFPRSLPLSTAAHMSARFTYVSPAGTLVKDGRPHGRVVDGGYFENSGATTTLEVLQAIDQLAAEDARWEKVQPFVIHISNEPVEAQFGADSLSGAPGHPLIAPRQLLNEALSPLWTLLNTRNARGLYARETVMWHAGPQNFLHFGLCRRSSNVPLGWVLSQSTRDRMQDQLAREQCVAKGAAPVFDNPASLKRIEQQLVVISATYKPAGL